MRFRCYGNLQFPLTYNGKSENRCYCYLTADILTKVLQKCSLSSPLRNIRILSKPLNLIGCHGNRKAKFAKKYSEIISEEAIRGMKLKLCRNVHNMKLYITCVFIAFAHVLLLL